MVAAARPTSTLWQGICACVVVVAGVVAAAGCSPAALPATSPAISQTTPSADASQEEAVDERADRNDALARELVAMAEEDQAERTGDPDLPPGTKLGPTKDYTRAARLKEIIAEHGWPTFDLVGEEASSAAWLIAQHADMDVEFQQGARDLLRLAVEEGQADPGELAYLDDRVQVNLGEPQTFGSQVRCQGGAPAPATPLVDAARVDELRQDVGLGTLQEYYDELAMMCADEQMAGQTAP